MKKWLFGFLFTGLVLSMGAPQAVSENSITKKVLNTVLEGVSSATQIIGIEYHPKRNWLTFTVEPKELDLKAAQLEFYTKKEGKPDYSLPLVALRSEHYSADITTIPAGYYHLRLGNIPNAKGHYVQGFEIPKRTPLLKVVHVTPTPIKHTVGDQYSFDLAIENHGVVPAKDVVLQIYAKNQMLKSTSPKFQISKDKIVRIPEIKARSKQALRLNFYAEGHAKDLVFGAYIENDDYICLLYTSDAADE